MTHFFRLTVLASQLVIDGIRSRTRRSKSVGRSDDEEKKKKCSRRNSDGEDASSLVESESGSKKRRKKKDTLEKSEDDRTEIRQHLTVSQSGKTKRKRSKSGTRELPMEKWTEADVFKWASSIVDSEVAQILQKQRIDGQVLLGT